MSNIPAHVKEAKISFQKDDGTVVELNVREALRGYEAAKEKIMEMFSKIHWRVVPSKGG